jgi:hypothetical protein
LQALNEAINYIEAVEINDYLLYYYGGRHKDHYELDMRLGGAVYAIHRGHSAVIVDTMDLPGQGAWVGIIYSQGTL